MESHNSETNLLIRAKKHRIILFCCVYWRSIIIILTPLILLPVAFLGQNQAYPTFFVFLTTAVYWMTDVLHPAAISIVPLAIYSICPRYRFEVFLCIELLDCLGIMMMMAAVEHSLVHQRIALKLLIYVGCSHYRLSLVLFFGAMFLSMWIPNTVACGLMMPIVKALLQSLEKMGIVEMYHTIEKIEQKSQKHEMRNPKPTDFTVFYFLGIAYSCSIGGLATLHGSQTNQIFNEYTVSMFPNLTRITFPQYMLLTLPGVLVTETLLYIWMNYFFLKVFKPRGIMVAPTVPTEEEARYIKTLLQTQYSQLGRITVRDVIVAATMLLTIPLHVAISTSRLYEETIGKDVFMHVGVTAPTIFCALILFIVPVDLNFLKFFKKNYDAINEPLPIGPSKACLNWIIVRDNVMWSALFTIAGSCMAFEALKQSGMTSELGRFLLLMQKCPRAVLVLAVIVFCKVLTEFASNSCVVYAMLPEIAKLSIEANIHPHCLMLAATLSASVPAHLAPSTPSMAMVSQYVHIPTWRMMLAGMGPSVIDVVVTWFTITLWSKVIIEDDI